MQRMRPSVPEHLSSHSALSSYGLFAPLAFWRLSLRSLVESLRSWEFPGFWGTMVFAMSPIPWKGSRNNNNNIRKHRKILVEAGKKMESKGFSTKVVLPRK